MRLRLGAPSPAPRLRAPARGAPALRYALRARRFCLRPPPPLCAAPAPAPPPVPSLRRPPSLALPLPRPSRAARALCPALGRVPSLCELGAFRQGPLSRLRLLASAVRPLPSSTRRRTLCSDPDGRGGAGTSTPCGVLVASGRDSPRGITPGPHVRSPTFRRPKVRDRSARTGGPAWYCPGLLGRVLVGGGLSDQRVPRPLRPSGEGLGDCRRSLGGEAHAAGGRRRPFVAVGSRSV